MKAAVILAKCTRQPTTYGIRIQSDDGETWLKTWAFPVDMNRARREGYGQDQISGYYFVDESFPGCPYCGAKQVISCNICHRASCWNGETEMDCAWCGNRMEGIYTTTEKLTYSTGEDF